MFIYLANQNYYCKKNIKIGGHVSDQHVNIWIWLQNGRLMKAVLNEDRGELKIYDEDDKLILKRTGLDKILIKEIEICIVRYGAKKLDKHAEPFRFL